MFSRGEQGQQSFAASHLLFDTCEGKIGTPHIFSRQYFFGNSLSIITILYFCNRNFRKKMLKTAKTWRQHSAILFAGLFLLYFINTTMFLHIHVINGETIVHSHVFSKNHKKLPSGGHTTSSLLLIAHLDNINCLDSGITEVDLSPLTKKIEVSFIPYIAETVSDPIGLTSGRAPPYCCFFS